MNPPSDQKIFFRTIQKLSKDLKQFQPAILRAIRNTAGQNDSQHFSLLHKIIGDPKALLALRFFIPREILNQASQVFGSAQKKSENSSSDKNEFTPEEMGQALSALTNSELSSINLDWLTTQMIHFGKETKQTTINYPEETMATILVLSLCTLPSYELDFFSS